VTSAAPIALDTLEFFLSLGIPIVEVYGMSEATGTTTIALPTRYRLGCAGYAIAGTELKIADDGEICMRGPHLFRGYFKDEAATAEALDDEGWLHSGDIGVLDTDGFVKITDRKKELIVTAGGKNIAPQMIEALLKGIPAVGQAVAIGDRRNFISALIALDGENVAAEAEKAGIPERSLKDVAASPVFHDYVQRQVEAVNAKLSRAESVRKFVILPAELTPEGGELTPTLKLKRRVIHEKYAREIDSMYR
jgi:long-subunit acyl-CoA synthetase (AMP-forming)